MKASILSLSPLALLLACTGALAQPTDTREGRLYTPGPFERLDVAGAAQVRLSQGDRDQVFVVGDSATQKDLQLELSGNRLRIRSSDSWKFWNRSRVQVEVQMRQLSQLILSGASDLHATGPIRTEQLSIGISGAGLVRLDDVVAGHLRFDISGAGDGQLAGQVGELKLGVSGKGKLMAEQLRASRATVSISGIGNAALWVTDELRISVSGVGSVDYWGQPQVRRSTSGMATVTGLGDKR